MEIKLTLNKSVWFRVKMTLKFALLCILKTQGRCRRTQQDLKGFQEIKNLGCFNLGLHESFPG